MAQQADDRQPVTPPPAPRGSTPKEPQRPRFGLSPRWIVLFLARLALNLFLTTRAMEPESRVRVPYSPFFLQQVSSANVKEITSKGTEIQGTFKKDVAFEDEKPTTRFRTEIPAFANTDELSKTLQDNDVTVNAKPLDRGSPWWQTLLFGFGPPGAFLRWPFIVRALGLLRHLNRSLQVAADGANSQDRWESRAVRGIGSASRAATVELTFSSSPPTPPLGYCKEHARLVTRCFRTRLARSSKNARRVCASFAPVSASF
jgi:hypothetical protein